MELKRGDEMNERIDELMIQAGARFEFLHGVHYDDFQYRKFAELIIQECIDYCGENLSKTVGGALKIHFGVKE